MQRESEKQPYDEADREPRLLSEDPPEEGGTGPKTDKGVPEEDEDDTSDHKAISPPEPWPTPVPKRREER